MSSVVAALGLHDREPTAVAVAAHPVAAYVQLIISLTHRTYGTTNADKVGDEVTEYIPPRARDRRAQEP